MRSGTAHTSTYILCTLPDLDLLCAFANGGQKLTFESGDVIVTSHANFPADMHASPGGHAQPRHAQMCGVRVQAWPDTCKDFPAAWNLCHEFACSHVSISSQARQRRHARLDARTGCSFFSLHNPLYVYPGLSYLGTRLGEARYAATPGRSRISSKNAPLTHQLTSARSSAVNALNSGWHVCTPAWIALDWIGLFFGKAGKGPKVERL